MYKFIRAMEQEVAMLKILQETRESFGSDLGAFLANLKLDDHFDVETKALEETENEFVLETVNFCFEVYSGYITVVRRSPTDFQKRYEGGTYAPTVSEKSRFFKILNND
ncbi:MAG: hypothetical protein J0L82_14565 [Deltaproteobacteria bacterium]|nr:hypothetical protein [Deltaproteobacteria bacterium]